MKREEKKEGKRQEKEGKKEIIKKDRR